MGGDATVMVTGSVHGFAPALTSFVGRAGEVERVAGLLGEYRMVTVTGPGGVGKTRLASEVARQVAGRYADGAWLVELAGVQDPAQVPAVVAAGLGVQQVSGESATESLVAALVRQQLLLVLDNCEHVLPAVAELCTALLAVADDVLLLATSREHAGVAGEARYRLRPLPVPGPRIPVEAGVPAAVVLFVDRARQADPEFVLNSETGPMVAGLVARLDGMPLAIELAAARVEALGLAQLLDRLEDSLRLLTSGDRAAAVRHQSLAATVEWSYRLLGELEQQVFRKLAVFPGSFTLDAAVAVAGPAAEPVVLHLVDCSLLTPPLSGPDGRGRYLMLETLRAFGRGQLASAGELAEAGSALAHYALQVAEQAAMVLQTGAGEVAAGRLLDAEDPAMQQALAWAMQHGSVTALRIAVALTYWWNLRGRAHEAYAQLTAAIRHAEPGSDIWCSAQYWLSQAAAETGDTAAMLSHSTAARDALAAGGPSRALAAALAARANALINIDRIPEGAAEAVRVLDMSREISYPEGEADALLDIGLAAHYLDDFDTAVRWARQACQIDPATITGNLARVSSIFLTTALIGSGEIKAARESGADALALARQAGDMQAEAFCMHILVGLDMRAGHLDQAWAQLGAASRLATRIRNKYRLRDCLGVGVDLCAATGHWAETITIMAAITTFNRDNGLTSRPRTVRHDEELRRDAALALGPELAAAAEERGRAMSLDTAAEFLLMLTETELQAPAAQEIPAKLSELSTRGRELVTLVAQGHTDAQIAGQLFISVSTVRSHLDRIRDKTTCRRRADLTRLALQEGLI